MADDNLIIRIAADAKKFSEELNKVEKQTEELSDGLKTVAIASGAAFAALVGGAAIAVHAFAESEKASLQLTQTLQNQGLAGKGLEAQYKNLAKAIQDKTGVDDDQIVSGLAILQNFIGQKEITPELATGLVDLAEKTGSVESASQLLGKAINGNVKGLKSYGIFIDEGLSPTERMAQIQEQLGQKLDGTAEAANKGLGGIRGLKTAFENFLEVIGERLAPIITVMIQKMTAFFKALENNKGLVDFIVKAGAIATAVTGAIFALSSLAFVFLKLQTAITVLVPILGLLASPFIAIPLAIAGTIAAGVALYNHWGEIFPALKKIFFDFIEAIGPVLKNFGSLLVGAFTGNLGLIKESAGNLIDSFTSAISSKPVEADIKVNANIENNEAAQDAVKKAAADKAQKERDESEKRKVSLQKVNDDIALSEAERSSKQYLDFKKEEKDLLEKIDDDKYKSIRGLLKEHLAEMQALEENASAQEVERNKTLENDVLAQNEEFQALTAEQQEAFRAQNEAQLLSSIETRQSTLQKAALDEANKKTEANNRFLEIQRKYGTAIAEIDKVTNSERVQNLKTTTGELSALQSSSNSTLKGIGKAAAVADISMKTAQSAMTVYQSTLGFFSFLGPFAQAPAIAAAAAAVAFGGEQIGKVLAAREGGLVTGGIPGQDSVPAMLAPGELVVPQANFSEVVNSVAAARTSNNQELAGGGGIAAAPAGSSTSVLIGFDGSEAERVLTARRVESRALGTLREAPA